MANMTAIQQLTERASKLETREKKRKAEENITTDKVVGFVSALATSGIAGYIDGRYDVSGKDEITGDGAHVFGVPVMPVVGGALAAAGMYIGGRVGSAMAFGGLGMGCGYVYSKGAQKGAKAALEAKK